jgi:hypothetical protein
MPTLAACGREACSTRCFVDLVLVVDLNIDGDGNLNMAGER